MKSHKRSNIFVDGGRKRQLSQPFAGNSPLSPLPPSAMMKLSTSAADHSLPQPPKKKKSRVAEWMETFRSIDALYENPSEMGSVVLSPLPSAVMKSAPLDAKLLPLVSLSRGEVLGGAFEVPSLYTVSGEIGSVVLSPLPSAVMKSSPPDIKILPLESLSGDEVLSVGSGDFGPYKWQGDDVELPLVYFDDYAAVIAAVNSGKGFRVSLPKSHH